MRRRFRSWTLNAALTTICVISGIAIPWIAFSEPPPGSTASPADDLATKVVAAILGIAFAGMAVRASLLSVELRDGVLRIINPLKTYNLDINSIDEVGLDPRGPFRGMAFVRASGKRIWLWCLQNTSESLRVRAQFEQLVVAVRSQSVDGPELAPKHVEKRGGFSPLEPASAIVPAIGIAIIIGATTAWPLGIALGISNVIVIAAIYRRAMFRERRR